MVQFVARNAAILGTACILAAGVAPAFAQENPNAHPDSNVSVRERARALYGPAGVHAGSFWLYPSADLSEIYSSNIFASDTAKDGGAATQLGVGLGVESDWNNHRLGGAIGATHRAYQDFSEQDFTDLTAQVGARLDISRLSAITVDAGASRLHENIAQAPTNDNLKKPVEYTRAGAGLRFSQAFNRLLIDASARYDDYNYKNGVLQSNAILEQDTRDVAVSTAGARVEYALGPTTSVYLAADHNWRKHDHNPVDPALNRDSEGDQIYGGVRLNLTDLIVGEVGVGQFQQRYDAPGVSDSSGATIHSRLEWYPDELVTVALEANRDAGDSGVPGAVGFVSDQLRLHVDYEFRRNIVFGVDLSGAKDDYAGIDRTDNRHAYGATIDYALNREWSAYGGYTRFSQDSSGPILTRGRTYDIDQVQIGVRFRR